MLGTEIFRAVKVAHKKFMLHMPIFCFFEEDDKNYRFKSPYSKKTTQIH